MELAEAIKIVKNGDIINRPIYEVWEIRSVLEAAGTPDAADALKIFDTKISPEQLKAASESKADDIKAVLNTIDSIKKCSKFCR